MWAVFSSFIKSCSRNFISVLSNWSLLTHILTLGLLKKDLHRPCSNFLDLFFVYFADFEMHLPVHVLSCHTSNVYFLWILKCMHYNVTGSEKTWKRILVCDHIKENKKNN